MSLSDLGLGGCKAFIHLFVDSESVTPQSPPRKAFIVIGSYNGNACPISSATLTNVLAKDASSVGDYTVTLSCCYSTAESFRAKSPLAGLIQHGLRWSGREPPVICLQSSAASYGQRVQQLLQHLTGRPLSELAGGNVPFPLSKSFDCERKEGKGQFRVLISVEGFAYRGMGAIDDMIAAIHNYPIAEAPSAAGAGTGSSAAGITALDTLLQTSTAPPAAAKTATVPALPALTAPAPGLASLLSSPASGSSSTIATGLPAVGPAGAIPAIPAPTAGGIAALTPPVAGLDGNSAGTDPRILKAQEMLREAQAAVAAEDAERAAEQKKAAAVQEKQSTPGAETEQELRNRIRRELLEEQQQERARREEEIKQQLRDELLGGNTGGSGASSSSAAAAPKANAMKAKAKAKGAAKAPAKAGSRAGKAKTVLKGGEKVKGA